MSKGLEALTYIKKDYCNKCVFSLRDVESEQLQKEIIERWIRANEGE